MIKWHRLDTVMRRHQTLRKKLLRSAFPLVLIGLLPTLIFAGELGTPPQFPRDLSTLSLPGSTGEIRRSLTTTGGFTVNPQNRSESEAFYNTYYLASENIANNWTGNLGACDQGTTAQAFRMRCCSGQIGSGPWRECRRTWPFLPLIVARPKRRPS